MNEEQINFLKDNVVGTHNAELIQMFYKEFGIMLTPRKLKYWKKNIT